MRRLHIRQLALYLVCLALAAASSASAQLDSSTRLPSSLGVAQTVETALQGAESAVGQVVVALAQVRAPVAMLKAKSSNPADAQALLEEVERLADTTMTAYQDAILATAEDAILGSSAATQSVAILTQIRVNLTVAVTQLTVMREAQATGDGPDDQIMAQAMQAKQRAARQAELAQQQAEAALQAARDLDFLSDADERQQAFQTIVNAKRTVQTHAMVMSAYVLELLALAANQASAIDATREAIKAALALLNARPADTQNAQAHINEEIQVAVVRAQLAQAVTRVAIANSDVTGVAAPDVALQAIKVVQKRVPKVLEAASRAAAAASRQTAYTIAAIARSDALAASAASRIVDAYIRLAIAQATEGTSNPALAARIAAADQLQNAVSLAQEAEVEASRATSAENANEVQQAVLRVEARVSLGAAWAQSATSWAYAAWAWSQGLTEVAEAAEAAAIATESAATMVEATVGVVATSAPSAPVAPDLPMNITSLALTTLSPSEVAAEVAAKEAAKQEAAAEQAVATETPTQAPPSLPGRNPATLSDDTSHLSGSFRPSLTGVASPSR